MNQRPSEQPVKEVEVEVVEGHVECAVVRSNVWRGVVVKIRIRVNRHVEAKPSVVRSRSAGSRC